MQRQDIVAVTYFESGNCRYISRLNYLGAIKQTCGWDDCAIRALSEELVLSRRRHAIEDTPTGRWAKAGWLQQ
jgi:hypothetical protein